MFKFPLVELIDRFCIAKLKFSKLGNNKEELDFYSKQMVNIDQTRVIDDLNQLYEIHSKIWDLEDDFKKYTIESKFDLAEVGRRAIIIRNLNHERYVIKNKIANKLNDKILEKKNYGGIDLVS